MKRIDLSDLNFSLDSILPDGDQHRLGNAVNEAVLALQKPGGVILVPTETVYGLICNASDAGAVERIYRLKARDGKKPLAWFVRHWQELPGYGAEMDENAVFLAENYTPGPLTLIIPRRDGTTLGFRTPAHKLIWDIMEKFSFPLASTSANLSGMPNALNVDDALEMLTGPVDLAVDGGSIPPDALASTVAMCSGGDVRILRQGALHLPDLPFEKK